jgi:hypothetical protein
MVNRGSTAKAQELDLKLQSMKRTASSSSSSSASSASSPRGATTDTPRSIVSIASARSLSSDGKTDRASSSPGSDDDDGDFEKPVADLKNAEDDNVDTSTIMSALKFGFNACFGASSADGDAAAQEITDADLEAILDRSRCSASYTTGRGKGGDDAPSAASSAEESKPTQAAAVLGRSNLLQEGLECSVADFEESAPLVNLRRLEGEDFSKEKISSLSDISSAWAEEQKRVRKSRMVQQHVVGVGMVNVLTSNMYDLEHGEPSVFEKELRNASAKPEAKRSSVSGRRYIHALTCCMYVRPSKYEMVSNNLSVCILGIFLVTAAKSWYRLPTPRLLSTLLGWRRSCLLQLLSCFLPYHLRWPRE